MPHGVETLQPPRERATTTIAPQARQRRRRCECQVGGSERRCSLLAQRSARLADVLRAGCAPRAHVRGARVSRRGDAGRDIERIGTAVSKHDHRGLRDRKQTPNQASHRRCRGVTQNTGQRCFYRLGIMNRPVQLDDCRARRRQRDVIESRVIVVHIKVGPAPPVLVAVPARSIPG
jgi:hypothetical protein